ncbi:MAG TPA: hypothetical protein DCS13_12710 [Candidatus Margulisbacteria bacterium]|nr:hypothetical protein [Candidatus Margulisiibacteriota bacterium]
MIVCFRKGRQLNVLFMYLIRLFYWQKNDKGEEGVTIMSVLIAENQTIGGRYQLVRRLGMGIASEVWEAEDIQAKNEVVIKLLKEDVSSKYIEDLLRYKKDMEGSVKLEHENLVRVYGAGDYQERQYLVVEKLAGESLDKVLERGKRHSVDEAIEIIKQIGHGIEYLHRSGKVHRDLSTRNVMVNEGTQEVKVGDYGVAQILELGKIKEENEIVMIFGYMSPEATGVVNKRIDERSDLYSLGIIFYELLTGEKPFKGRDVNRLLHEQVAVVAPSPGSSDRAVPAVISKIVMKLIEKEPELRYQEIGGLLYDLDRYSKGEKSFVVGEKDKKVKLNYQTNLVGRDEELFTVKQLIKEAKGGKGGICLIGGEAGIGKSRLAEEVRGEVFSLEGVVFRGRCVDQVNKIPYLPFKDILNEYLRVLDKLPDAQKAQEIAALKEVVGELGEIILKINSGISSVFENVPKLVPLDPTKDNKRFLMVAADFFCQLMRSNNKVCVLFIDDLQWADEGSLSLMEEICERINQSHLVMLGTYRDNEVDAEHSLSKIKNKMKDQGLAEIQLLPFDLNRMNKLIANLLGEAQEKSKELSEYILEKTKGNPFYAINVVRELIDKNAVEWIDGLWEKKWNKIRELIIPTNMVDLILRRINKINDELLNVLIIGAIIGREFDLELLFELIDNDKETIIKLIDEGVGLQLLELSSERGKLLFVHDRVRDAFYRKIDRNNIEELHVRIADAIEKINKETIDKVVFDLAYHYTAGKNKEKSLLYSLPAAAKAKEGYANEEAVKYFEIAIALLEEQQKVGEEVWISAHNETAEVYEVMGKMADAVRIYTALLPYKNTSLDQAAIYRKIGGAWFKLGELNACEESLTKSITLLGEKVPLGKYSEIKFLLKELVVFLYRNLIPPKVKLGNDNASIITAKEVTQLYLEMAALYSMMNVNKLLWSILRAVNIAESKIGTSKELGLALNMVSIGYVTVGLFKKAEKISDRAIKMLNELDEEVELAKVKMWTGFSYLSSCDYENVLEIEKAAAETLKRIGSMWEYAYTMAWSGTSNMFQGNYKKALECYFIYFNVSTMNKDEHGICCAADMLVRAFVETGDFEKARKYGEKSLQVSEDKKIWYVHCRANADIGLLYLESGDYDLAIQHLEKARDIHRKTGKSFFKDMVVYLYISLADSYIEKYRRDGFGISKSDRKIAIKQIKVAINEALKATKPWPNHHGGSLRIAAKHSALVKNNKAANSYFLKSIAHLESIRRKYELAKTYYEYGRFLHEEIGQKASRPKFDKAFQIFKEINSTAYLERLTHILGIKDVQAESVQDRLTDRRDLTSIIEVSNNLSSILELDKLLEKIMDVSIEITGAQRGYLYLYSGTERDLSIKVIREVGGESKINDIPVCRRVIEKATESENTVLVGDAGEESWLKNDDVVMKYGLKSILCIPLRTRDELIGIVYLDNKLVGGLFTEKKREVLGTILVQASISIENARTTEELMNMHRELARHAEILEEKVKERTEELADKNKILVEQNEQIKRQESMLVQKEKLAALGDIVAGVAHEINTPLLAITIGMNGYKRYTDDLRSIFETNKTKIEYSGDKFFEVNHERYSEDIDSLFDALDRIRMHITNMKSFIKFQEAAKGEFDINKEIITTLNIVNFKLPSNVSIETELGEGIPKVYGSAAEMNQVFMNLIVNGIESIPKEQKGIVSIKTFNQIIEGRSQVIIEIKDNGMGMSEEQKNRVFKDRFTTKENGTGIGLMLCSEIIKRHEAELYVADSIPGSGTTFRIEVYCIK